MGKVVHVCDLAGGVADKGPRDLVSFDTASVICDTDHADPAVTDLYGNGSRTCIDGIFHQFLDDIERSFNDFSCRDPADGFLCEESDFHNLFLFLFPSFAAEMFSFLGN